MPFDSKRFLQPPAELRGAPFFALNHDLTDHQRIFDYVDAFQEMGIGGFHLHVRCGLKTPYMSPEFLEALSAVRDHAASKGMLSYLYDEDTWPSGFAGGEVTRELKFRQRWVELKRGPVQNPDRYGQPLCAYRIELDDNGCLLQSRRIVPEAAGKEDWVLTRCMAPDNDRYNGAAYLDVLNPEAVQAFIDSTHERFLAHFGGSFPEDVPAIFTDEPQMFSSHGLDTPSEGIARFAWTDDLPERFQEKTGEDLLDLLPWVFWSTPEGPGYFRWVFRDFLTECFATAFSDQIGQWCEKNGIALTGHVNGENTLAHQMSEVGECMRQYRAFQIPGIDVLCDQYLPLAAKQAVSVARQDGRRGVMSELYGVTNWDFPFSGHKRQGDWQAALGITLRVHHLAWLSMEGQSKRDYPACIGPQSPWYREYPLVEDHFARVGAALTSGRARVRIGVIHPEESAWMCGGPRSQDNTRLTALDRSIDQLVTALLSHTLDFDFIAESLLPGQERDTDSALLAVGEMGYEVVVVPELLTLRECTLKSLQAFLQRGGTVLVSGKLPPRCDGKKSDAPKEILRQARVISSDPPELVEALEPWRDITVSDGRGLPAPEVNYQMRDLDHGRILFCSCRRKSVLNQALWTNENRYIHGKISIQGDWQVTELDTSSGEEKCVAYVQHDGCTVVPWELQPAAHKLLKLQPGKGECSLPQVEWTAVGDLPEPERVRLEEANVLLLDRAAVRVNGGDWLAPEDTLVTQLQLAGHFGWPDWGQPYSVKNPGPKQRICRRFVFETEISLPDLRLVCERAGEAEITLDGEPVPAVPNGWWVDRDLPTVPLPALSPGKHMLDVELELDGVNRHLEWCYLLGDFQVQTRGAQAGIVEAAPETFWGDLVHQGAPFYGGNVEYRISVEITDSGVYALQIPNFGGHLLRVSCDGKDCGPVAYAPYRVELGELQPGGHDIGVLAYGNRHNSFGALHNNRPDWNWWGPDSWRGEGTERTDVWQFKPSGILRAPLLERKGGTASRRFNETALHH